MIAELSSPTAASHGYSDDFVGEATPAEITGQIGNVFARALDLLPMGVMAVNRACRIRAANRAAKYALETSDMIADVSGFLVVTIKSQERLLRDAVRQACEVEGSRFAFRINRPFGRPLMLLVTSAKTGGPMEVNDDGTALIFLAEAAWTYRADEQVLRELFGFTPAEARVAAILMQGKSVEAAAVALGISENTTRNHLKRLFAKTKTNKQGELVQLLLRSPALVTLELDGGSETLDPIVEYRAS